MVAARAGELFVTLGGASGCKCHCVESVAKSRDAVALLVNFTAELAAQVALITFMGASRLKFVENIVALVVQTRQTLDGDIIPINCN